MKVTLLSYTQDAVDLLLFTKSTRLKMTPNGLDDVATRPWQEKMEELEYMRRTIQSSWEFVDYIFSIEDVTRAFTHQLVRHRVGTSFAQQSQRSVDARDFTFEAGPSLVGDKRELYDEEMFNIAHTYGKLVELGANIEDARGILPTNIHTNIIFKANLRTLHEMGLKRLCVKTQGEFQNVFREIRKAVINVHPWAENFIQVWCGFHGTCAFPDFPTRKCPMKPYVYNPYSGTAYGSSEPPKPVDFIRKIAEESGTQHVQTEVKK